ncbi:MAG: hypothetical protein IIU28_02190 [Lachnospiraceae bacterium]|nr:hypothetical protein [Lachnospiraceae bacterium]
MALTNRCVRKGMGYCVGYSPKLHKYLIQTVTGVAVRYFNITREEFNLFTENPETLDILADKCKKFGTGSQRFICSSVTLENTPTQLKYYEMIMSD